MSTKKVEVNEETTIEVLVDGDFGMLISNEQAAIGFGIEPGTIRWRKNESVNELLENKHWVSREVSTAGGKQSANFWTLRGILRLQVYIQTPESSEFGAWAEGIIFDSTAVNQSGRSELLKKEAGLKRKITAKQTEVDEIQAVIDLNDLKAQMTDVKTKLRSMDSTFISGILKTWDEALKK